MNEETKNKQNKIKKNLTKKKSNDTID